MTTVDDGHMPIWMLYSYLGLSGLLDTSLPNPTPSTGGYAITSSGYGWING